MNSLYRVLILFFFFVLSGHAQILPENIGSTQYGTGHLAAAQKYESRVRAIGKKFKWSEAVENRNVALLEKLLCDQSQSIGTYLTAANLPITERREFLKTITILQRQDQYKVAQLFMIGKERAVATDGHHRVRTMVKLSEVLNEAAVVWPTEVRKVMEPLKRIKPNGDYVVSLPLLKADVVEKLPADARARDVMQSILEHKMGLWSDPKDDALASSFYGKKKSKKASKKELDYLASKLGIIDGPKGVTFNPIAKLPDSPMRTLMGSYFASRGIKADTKISFKAYVEFYLGDDIKVLVAKDPKRFPVLHNLLLRPSTIEEQRSHLRVAMEELDQLFAFNDALIKKTSSLAATGPGRVEDLLFKMKFHTCKKFVDLTVPD